MIEYKEDDLMGKTQTTYNKEFKQQSVTIFKTSGKSKTQIAVELA
ncbi:hypothetical protein KDI_52970 [Dictyobacter arantiisoli]|uniref:Transposase n=1 Tax=Dictyobacter arantiisoli TaxID=2014874 RepID=A0A5A5TL05_9CHLR|nr:hypothetical protein [Dictyobacter arantiisoli]GCF11733.1 hypothetical protein KDI_52970 [Dictyobacter arantiisoli]